MDGEVSNSTHADEFAKAYPDRFFEMYIAEQQLVATAVGMSVRGYRPFVSTFAAFFARAYDFIRMAGISQANIRLVGSHAGVEIGQDGPSQMALEDLGSMRASHKGQFRKRRGPLPGGRTGRGGARGVRGGRQPARGPPRGEGPADVRQTGGAHERRRHLRPAHRGRRNQASRREVVAWRQRRAYRHR